MTSTKSKTPFPSIQYAFPKRPETKHNQELLNSSTPQGSTSTTICDNKTI
ncbi:hypothetical protein Scep_025276 [Stephania cephalantha]|uniref:Uncharacterized protein n=1 Tax=Stephania cephalantha TaxID=152367 RepID=A0AAP0HR33_9MAGN